MPYRIDLADPPDHAFDTLVDLGALDVEGDVTALAALLPDGIAPAAVANALGLPDVHVTAAVGRDDDSVWTLSPRAVRTRTLSIVPSQLPSSPEAIRIVYGSAFGTGLHATTALCLEMIEDLVDAAHPGSMLDVGTGSGILALAALRRGVAQAVGLDIDSAALQVAAANARLNALSSRLTLVCGGVSALRGWWPLVAANIRAAELMEMAATLVQRVASGGFLVLSGVSESVAADVENTYRRLGMTQANIARRNGWTALLLRASW